MIVKLKNTGKAPSGGYDARGRAFVLAPGEERNVHLSDRYAAEVRRRDGTLKVLGAAVPVSAPEGKRDPSVAPDAPSDEVRDAARELLARSDDMHHATLRAEAVPILGADAPTKKDEILATLEAIAASDD